MPETAEALAEILPASERTQIIEVTERQVVRSEGGPEESEKTTKVFVRPLPFRRWLTAMKHIGVCLQYLPAEGFSFDDAKSIVYLISLMGEAQDQLIALACLATDQTPEFFDRIDPDDGVRIIASVVQVNKDFFVQKVLPLLNEYQPAITETLGQTPSPSLSEQDTDGQTS